MTAADDAYQHLIAEHITHAEHVLDEHTAHQHGVDSMTVGVHGGSQRHQFRCVGGPAGWLSPLWVTRCWGEGTHWLQRCRRAGSRHECGTVV
jgi:hypothetical protein